MDTNTISSLAMGFWLPEIVDKVRKAIEKGFPLFEGAVNFTGTMEAFAKQASASFPECFSGPQFALGVFLRAIVNAFTFFISIFVSVRLKECQMLCYKTSCIAARCIIWYGWLSETKIQEYKTAFKDMSENIAFVNVWNSTQDKITMHIKKKDFPSVILNSIRMFQANPVDQWDSWPHFGENYVSYCKRAYSRLCHIILWFDYSKVHDDIVANITTMDEVEIKFKRSFDCLLEAIEQMPRVGKDDDEYSSADIFHASVSNDSID